MQQWRRTLSSHFVPESLECCEPRAVFAHLHLACAKQALDAPDAPLRMNSIARKYRLVIAE